VKRKKNSLPEPRKDRFQIRAYKEKDWIGLKDLLREYLRLSPEDEARDDRELALQMKRPGFYPREDIFVAISQGKIAGFLQMIREVSIGRLIFDIFVSPPFRCNGLGTEFLKTALKRKNVEDLSCLHHCVSQENRAGAESFLLKRGFRLARSFQIMETDLSLLWRGEKPSDSIRDGCFQPGDEGKLASLQNRIFINSWGFCPNTPQEISYYLALTRCSLDEIMVLHGKKGVEGYVWPHFIDLPESRSHIKKCRIHMFGVLLDFRRKGRGRMLLSSALSWIKERGYRFLELTVDDQNKAAICLYRSLGFKNKERLYWYENNHIGVCKFERK